MYAVGTCSEETEAKPIPINIVSEHSFNCTWIPLVHSATESGPIAYKMGKKNKIK